MKSEIDQCKLCISLGDPHLSNLLEQIKKATQWADLIEIRLDKLYHIDVDKLSHIKKMTSCPVIWTLRKASHGGEFQGSEQERLNLLRSILLNLQPSYMDLEGDIPKQIVEEFQKLSPQTRWIISWHDLNETPANLDSIYLKISKLHASYYKIAVQAQSTTDAIRMLKFTKRINQSKSHVCGICMGEFGQLTRILSPMVKQPFTYASLEKKRETAAGQLTAEELIFTYRFREMNQDTRLLGLIGRPVDKSYSHVTHNAVLKHLAVNAVYLKFHLMDEELFPFFKEIESLQVMGLSVTMPFKEKVINLLQEGHDLTACNTLVSTPNGWLGFNTDGVGALRALGFLSLKNQKTIILGAGGTAKAVAKAFFLNGADVVILNRTIERAKEIAIPLKARWGGLELLPQLTQEGYTCIVQATSVGMAPAIEETPVPSDWIGNDAVVLDVISNPSETRLLREIKNRGGRTISGKELFIHQAVEQFVCWFGLKMSPKNAHSNVSDEQFRNRCEEIEQTIRKHLPR